MTENKTVLVGMSGGVDSSVTAALLLQQGYQVIGITLKVAPDIGFPAADAKVVCDFLGVRHYVLDACAAFHETVIQNFKSEYLCGRTPNPCVLCNRHIKFRYMMNALADFGAAYLATGHYAGIDYCPKTNRYLLSRSEADKKDQTYFLYALEQEQLAHSLFPLRTYTKEMVRDMAKQLSIPTAEKPDSQEVCFIPDNDYIRYLHDNTDTPESSGNFVTTEGQILGIHRGISNYTVGQRKGLGIAVNRPVYVLSIDTSRNEIILGNEEDLYHRELLIRNWSFIPFAELTAPLPVTAKIRYAAKEAPATIQPVIGNLECVRVTFSEPQKSITPGQSAVFYDGNIIVGGGVIDRAL